MRIALRLTVPFLTLLGVLSSAALVAGDGHDQRGGQAAHVHGVASMNLVLEGQDLQLELDSPAANLVGFEHAPAGEADREALNAAVEKLSDVDRLFVFGGAAGCQSEDVKIASALLEAEDPGKDHGHEDEHHADVRAAYFFTCRDPARLEWLTVGFFEHFPGMESLLVQFIIGDRQGGAELSQTNRVLSLR